MTIEGPELVVFDFDETIVGCNSDTFINRLAPNGSIPNDVTAHWDSNNWTQYMKHVFMYLHKCDVNENDLRKCLETMPFVSGMKQLILNCRNSGDQHFELIIISDANSIFIGHTLEYHQLDKAFRKVFTNPAEFVNGCLQIEEYHYQESCSLSARNLCKGQVLSDYIRERKEKDGVSYSRVSYVGDGLNDVCPALKLTSNDRVFARFGFPFHKRLKVNEQLKAKMYPFKDGYEIWNVLEKTHVHGKLNNDMTMAKNNAGDDF